MGLRPNSSYLSLKDFADFAGLAKQKFSLQESTYKGAMFGCKAQETGAKQKL